MDYLQLGLLIYTIVGFVMAVLFTWVIDKKQGRVLARGAIGVSLISIIWPASLIIAIVAGVCFKDLGDKGRL